jgi:hypothetical protein
VSCLILDSSATLAWIYGDEVTEATHGSKGRLDGNNAGNHADPVQAHPD